MPFEYVHRPYLEPKGKKLKGMLFWSIILILVFYGFSRWFNAPEKNPPEEKRDVAIETRSDAPEKKEVNKKEHTISEGDIPAEVFSQYGKWDANDTATLLEAGKDVYDLSNLKLGKAIRFYFGNEERADKMEYDRDTERMIIAERNGDDFSIREEKIAYEVSQEVASATINNFLYADALDAGLSEPTVLEIGDIFAFDIDFTTEIRQGDSFTVIYEKRKRDGKDGPDGLVLAAKFVNEGTAYYAYHFDNDGQGGFYDAEGRVLEKQFLKAPLSFRYISSGYTGARVNPITRTVMSHYQIDYAAPTGTPVVSSGRGTIVSAGREGGWGNIVRIRHDNGYTTHYAHLSAFAKGVRSGSSVSQGQVIGYVGSTGWSTGPHLDYGMKLNGAPVNPLSLKLPKGNPLGEDKMGAFEELKQKYNEILR